jgi:hypothetical protein
MAGFAARRAEAQPASDEAQASAGAKILPPLSPCGDCGAGQCVVVHIFCDANLDKARQPSEDVPAGEGIMAEVQGVGQFETNGFFCTSAATLNVRARRGAIIGRYKLMPTMASLDVEVARATVNFQCGGVDATGPDIANMRVQVTNDATLANGQTHCYPLNTNIAHLTRRGNIVGPGLDKSFASGACGNWNIGVAAATVNFQCNGVDVVDADLVNMRVDVTNDGQLADGTQRYYPLDTWIQHRMRRGSIAGISQSKLFSAGACGNWNLAIARQQVNFECNGTVSTDPNLRLDVTSDGLLAQGDVHDYPITSISYRVTRGLIFGPNQNKSLTAADCGVLNVHVANVRMSLRLAGVEVGAGDSARVEIQNLGIEKNGDTFSVPISTCLKYRRIRNGFTGPYSVCPNKTFAQNECGNWVVNFDDFGH